MKMRNKGKVHPFTSSSSSSSSSPDADSLSVLKLLPAAILTLVSVISLEDRQVLAYMITRSLKSTNPSSDKKKSSKKQCTGGHNSPALFDCDCFHCYTSFWLRWDSSPNRELIHQAIEAFDDHLNAGDHLKIKRRDKLARRKTQNPIDAAPDYPSAQSPETQQGEVSEKSVDEDEEKVSEDDTAVVVRTTSHKGLARKVLPDLMGIFHSRYWGLWSPNV